MKELYSIGEVASQTGLTVDTLRVWERRYGRPVPIRLPSGHRRFTADQLHWLRRVSEALHLGHRPGQAVRAEAQELDAWIAQATGGRAEDPALDDWVEEVQKLSTEGLRSRIAGDFDPEQPGAFFDQRLAPFLVRVGRSWADGQLGVRHEHLVSEVVSEFLRERGQALGAPLSDPPVVLATLSGERHALGIRMAALLCHAAGVRPFVLGADVPDDEILSATRELGACAVVLSISLASAGRDTERRLTSLAGELPEGIELVVGGRGLRTTRRARQGITSLRDYAALECWLRDLPRPSPEPSAERRFVAGRPSGGRGGADVQGLMLSS